MPITFINDPSSSGPILCIDFGTTHSIVASTNANEPYILEDAEGPFDVPTTVSYTNKAQSKDHCVYSIKRLIGQSATKAQQLGFNATVTENGQVGIITESGTHTVFSIVLKFFQQLYTRTSKKLQENFSPQVVITVPAYFTQNSKNEIRLAATQAGWEPVRLLSEPTAAAFEANLQNQNGLFLVYDWGGGTFDISLVESQDGLLLVQALAGDPLLGGDDFDMLLAQHCTKQQGPSQEDIIQAKKYKHKLCASETISFAGTTVTPENFFDIVSPLINKTLQLCDQVLHDANISYADISSILCVGGTSKYQKISEKLKQHTQCQVNTPSRPEHSVVLGGAVYANLLAKGQTPTLIDALPLSIGMEIGQGLMEVMIPRNTPVPYNTTQKFTTSVNQQKYIAINIFQGERDLTKYCTLIGTCSLGPIPPMPAGYPQVEVSFSVDAEGLLHIMAIEKISETTISTTLTHSWSVNNKEDIIKQSAQFALEDAQEYHFALLVQKATFLTNGIQHAYAKTTPVYLKSAWLQQNIHSLTSEEISSKIEELESLIKE